MKHKCPLPTISAVSPTTKFPFEYEHGIHLLEFKFLLFVFLLYLSDLVESCIQQASIYRQFQLKDTDLLMSLVGFGKGY